MRRRRRGLGASAAEHSQRRDRYVEGGIAQAERALVALQGNVTPRDCAVAYEHLSGAKWSNGAAWANRDSGGVGRAGGATLTDFDRKLQHANDLFRNTCFPRR